jgi:deoxycytidine triphosphate deaminase
MLSDIDIKKELGRNIFLYPIVGGNIHGNSLNLRPSHLAWVIENDGQSASSIYNPHTKNIIIPPHKFALIATQEVLGVTNTIGGSYHSKVSLVSKGLSHIGTTLDPGWSGISLIAVYNYGKTPISIHTDTESVITVMFHYLTSPAEKLDKHASSHRHLIESYMSDEEKRWLKKFEFKYPNEILKLMETDEAYQELQQKRKIENVKAHKSKFSYHLRHSRIVKNLYMLIGVVIFNFILWQFKSELNLSDNSFIITLIVPWLSATFAQISTY